MTDRLMYFTQGRTNDKHYARGMVPLNKKEFVYINTETGEGLEIIFDRLAKFINYKAFKSSVFADSIDDAKSEIYLLILDGIPRFKYNEDGENISILTFLKGHVSKRLINSYKYASEQKRQASWIKNTLFKFKCPKCRSIAIRDESDGKPCHICKTDFSNEWRKYRIMLKPGSNTHYYDNNDNDSEDICDKQVSFGSFLLSDDEQEKRTINKVDIQRYARTLTGLHRRAFYLLIEGHNINEIANKMQMKSSEVTELFEKMKFEFASLN